MDIEVLKTKRKSLRTAFTVCSKNVSEKVKTESLSGEEIDALSKQIQDKFARLESTQEEISNLLLQDDTLTDITCHIL